MHRPRRKWEKLRQMGASLTLRCVLSGLLALVLIQLSLTAGGLLPPVAGLDPIAAPAAFYGVNLLALAAAMGVAYTVLRDGLAGLRGTPSAETMPALAAVAALVQAAVALLNAKSYASSGMTLLSGVAALGLCLALVGGRVMLSAVEAGHRLASSGEDYQGAVRIKDKDLVRSLAQAMEEKDPWVLFSRPVEWSAGFVDQHFGARASERRTRKTSYILLGTAVLSGLVFLLFGAGINGAAAAAASVLCMGAPLSSTLVAAVAALRLQRTAAAAGAVVPGWAATEELGGIDTVQLDADDLFGPDSVNLEDIRIFKGGRIDRDILYTASVLNQSCNTLRACSARSLRTAPIFCSRSRTWRPTGVWALPLGATTTASCWATAPIWNRRESPCRSRSMRPSTPRMERCRSCTWRCPATCTPCLCCAMWAGAIPPGPWPCFSGRISA